MDVVCCSREGLLARKVLLGQTKGYTRHPQLIRFRETGNPLQTMDLYLKAVHEESIRRGYSFDLSKISPCACQPSSRLLLPDKQLEYEFHHLLNKLRKRSPQQYSLLQQTTYCTNKFFHFKISFSFYKLYLYINNSNCY